MWLQFIINQSAVAGGVSGLLEGAGIPWPGGMILTAAGAQDQGTVAALVIGTLFAAGYTVTAILQYLAGRYCAHLLTRWLSPARRAGIERLMRRYGQVAVLWTRPLAIGNYISIPAGMMRMHPGKFVAYTFVGIWPWAVGMAAAGSLVGARVTAAALLLPWLAGVMGLVGLMGAAYRLWSRCWVERQARRDAA